MSVVSDRWKQASERYAVLKPREQILIAAVAVVIVLVLCDWLLWAPQRASKQRLDQQVAETRTQIATLQSLQTDTQQKLAADPDKELRAQIDEVRVHIATQDQALSRLMVDLIPPDAMASVLRDLLMKRKQLKLVALANTPATPAFVDSLPVGTLPGAGTTTAPSGEAAPLPMIYKHGLALTFRGSYFDVVDYLHTLVADDATDDGKRRFFWESIDYHVDKYPEAEVTLKVYTLGNKEAWIGA